MDEATPRRLLDAVRNGAVHPDDAIAELRRLPFADLGFARVDHHRGLRQGMPEAVYGPGKARNGPRVRETTAALLARFAAAPPVSGAVVLASFSELTGAE